MAKAKDSKQSSGKAKAPSSIQQKDLPRLPISECFVLLKQMHDNAASGSLSNEDMASLLGTSPNTTKTKYTIWAAEAYGLIYKDEKSEYSLSETGRKIVAPTYPNEDIEAIRKAVLTPNILSKFYLEHNNYPIPQETFLINKLETKYGLPKDRINESIQIILQNAKDASILVFNEKEQKNYIIIESVPPKRSDTSESGAQNGDDHDDNIELGEKEKPEEANEWDSTCFIVCPIGDDESIERKHSDMILKHLIEPVMKDYNLKPVRSDKIEKTGLITQQILLHLAKAKLCIIDLSFNNPNVFYEMGVRHTCLLPSIPIIRKGDKIPFDVSQGRTIKIDTSDPYTMIDRMDSARKELGEYIKTILTDKKEVSDDNPIKTYLPTLKVTLQ